MTKKEILIILFLICIGVIRLLFFLSAPQDEYYKAVDRKVVFVGIISEYKDERETQVRYTVRPENQKFNILVPVYDKKSQLNYGDIVQVQGVLSLPESFETENGRIFDYGKYLEARDTFFIIKNANIQKLDEGGNRVKKTLFVFRERFENSLEKIMPSRDSGFVDGLLLGNKGGIGKDDTEAFVRTGTIHIVALSGFNVMIVAEAFMRLMYLVTSGLVSYIGAGVVIVLFVTMAGFGATAVRAGLMAILALYARFTGHTYNALRGLFIVSVVMFLFNPRVIFDVSFHLSVIATFGVIALPSKIIKYFRWIPMQYGFRDMLLTTVSATISVVPYIMYVMGNFSVISVLVNILILPLIPFIMLFGFIAGFIGLFSGLIATPFAYITHIGNTYIFNIVHLFSKLPFASIEISKFPLVFVLLFYVILLWWVFKKEEKSEDL